MAKTKGTGPKKIVGGVKIGGQKNNNNKPKAGGVNKAQNLKAKLKGNQGLKQKLANGIQRGPNGQQRAPGGGAKAPPKPQGRHTLLLKQDTSAASSKTWSDYNNTNEAIDGFIATYEAKLRNLNPGLKTLTYSVADLHQYVDSMHDISLLVSDPQTKQYGERMLAP